MILIIVYNFNMKSLKILYVSLIVLFTTNLHSFENEKSELGFYFSTKVYEERHPVDNSFFMSQDGWMIGLNTNDEYYEKDFYFGFKNRLAYGQVDYTSNGTGTMTGIPDYQLEQRILRIPFEGTNSRTTLFSGLGFRYLLNQMGLKASSTGHSGYDRESRYLYMPLGVILSLEN